MTTQQEFKQTEIGKIPKDWEVAPAEKICSKVTDGTHDTPKPVEKGYFLITSKHIKNGQIDFSDAYFISEKEFIEVNKRSKVNTYDVLFSMIGTIGETTIVREDYPKFAIKNVGLFKTNSDKILALWLHYYFKSKFAENYIRNNLKGTTQQYIPLFALRSFPIVVPSIVEQKKIAEILSTVDKAIEKVGEAIEKTERLKKGLMQELLTKGIGHKEFKDTEIGKMPKKWEVIELSNLVDIKSGLYFKYSEFTKIGVKCLKIDNVGFGKVIWDTVTFLPEDYLNKYPELVLKANDIVIALNRPIIDGNLKIGILEEKDSPSILYQRVGNVIVRDRKKVDQNYLFCTFSGHYFKRVLSKSLVGTDQPYIRTPVFLKLKLPLPPLPEQKKIAEVLSTVDKRLELLRKKKERLERVKKGLMNDLLSGKRRVKTS